MKKLAVATLAALSLGALHAADPTPAAAPQPPPPPPASADAQPPAPRKPLPPLDEARPPRQRPDGKADRPKGREQRPGQDRADWQRHRMNQRPGFAQGPGGPGGPGRPEGKQKPKMGHGEMLTDALDLTPEQQKKAREILQATKPKLQAAREEGLAKEKAILEDAIKELRPSLSAEQQAVLDDLQKLRADRAALKKAKAAGKPAKADKKKKDDA